jgi:hypothetical protein
MIEPQNESNDIVDENPKILADQFAETAIQTSKKDNLSVFVNNLKIYCSMIIEN